MKILDCTLRDGGYYTNWDFENKLVLEYLKSMNSLPIDFIELGYRSKPLSGYLGEFFYCPVDVVRKIRKLSTKQLVIMLNEKDIDSEVAIEILSPLVDLVDLIRIAVDPKRFDSSLELAKTVKSMGFKVGFNIMYMSTWSSNKDFINSLTKVDGIIEYLYMVDSYGGVYPEDVQEIYGLVREKTNVKIGFHGHNNLELALINTITAINCGVDIVDATVTGMGRGAGNLKTELLLTALNSKNKIDLNFNTLSSIVGLFNKLKNDYEWGTNLPYMVSGANSLPQKDVMEWVGKRFYSINSIIRALDNKSKGRVDNINLNNLDSKEISRDVLIIGGGPSATIHSNAVKSFLNANLNVLVVHVSSKNVKAYEHVSNRQVHCLAGNEGLRLEKLFKELKSENRMAILPPYPRPMGTYIPSYFNGNSYQLVEINFTQIHTNSITAIAIQTALEFGAKNIYFIGYDGYSFEVTQNELELYNENKELFSLLNSMDLNVSSLTETKYSELAEKSVYSII